MRRLELADGDLEADFVPGAGMVGTSLRHRGAELLGQRGGLEAYVAERKTMGIPLLHPWANRLGQWRFAVADREVDIGAVQPPPRTDEQGLPMHGLLTGVGGWEAEQPGPGRLTARFDFAARDDLMAAFPFAHELVIDVQLADATLTIATTVTATGDGPVPVSFGFHPYLCLPDVARADWEVEVPVRERLLLDERMLPTGALEPVAVAPGPLGDRTFDDAYTAPEGPFVLAGGGRRLELEFLEGYPYAQVFAPPTDDVIAFEPMTAPANALVTGEELPVLAPGERHRGVFALRVA